MSSLTTTASVRWLTGLTGCLLSLPTVLAVPNATATPDAGALQAAQQKLEAVVLPPKVQGKTVIRANMPTRATSLASLKLSVQGFKLENHPLIDAAEVDRVLQPWKGRELNFAEFEQAVHAVADYLRQHGHPQAEVKVSRATVSNGSVAVAINGLSAGEPVAPTVAVQQFKVDGLTKASDAEVQAVLAPWVGRDLTVPEMQKAADSVAALLRDKGYPLAQTFLPPQRIDGGTIQISVQEGVVDGTVGRQGVTVATKGERVNQEVIETILERGVTPGEPIETAQLERAIRLAGDLPGIKSVRANLSPGSQPGTTQVLAEVDESQPVNAIIWADNYSNRYSGEARINAVLNLNSPSGHGEQYSVNVSASEGMSSGKLAAQVPVGSDGVRVGASISAMKVDIGKEFAPLSLNSDTFVASLYASYPLVRSAERNIWLTGNYDDKLVRNQLLGANESDRHLSLLTLGASGDGLDRWMGQNNWGVALTLGDVDLSGNEAFQALDAASARTEGGFSKLNWNYSRLAPLSVGSRWSWQVALSGQFADRNLDTVEKFQLGGPNGVRAYPVGEAIGDNGWLASLEFRYDALQTSWGLLQLSTFVDAGGIQQYKKPWSSSFLGDSPNSYDLAGYGVGASLVKDERGSLKLMVSRRLGDNPNASASGYDSDGQQRATRVWIFANIVF